MKNTIQDIKNMKPFRLVLIVSLLVSLQLQLYAQLNKGNLIKNLTGQGSSNLTNDEIIKGLKEALTLGSKNASEKASVIDGFYKNPQIKIPFPKEAQQMEQTLNNLGMSQQTRDFVKALNRAAEDASKKAAPIFADAITKMTINDGINILKGSDDAATQYLRQTASAPLKEAFKPIVKSSLQKVEITKYWSPLAKTYNKMPMVNKVNPDLEEYVTLKAIDGLFLLLAEEELKIRKDPLARTSDLLKKVFGGK